MIQEKDFLYRVPVKTAPITTPGGQIRNPEILVDVEGGEFMHGNILDANSTNKLINQSVKDAVDNKLIESGYVTKDLLEAETTRATEQENSLKTFIDAETSARTKGDEDLSSKIKAEQTRAEGKEKEISDKLAIVNGDSNTEGSFRKAIADVIAAAPEDLDTLKEIADKLAGNDDLHTALNQAITEKADASALANEVSRATSVESGLQAAIATKADATALSNYVLTTALNQQVDTLNTAISAKQDAGSYIPYDQTVTPRYKIDKDLMIDNSEGSAVLGTYSISAISNSNTEIQINPNGIIMRDDDNTIRLARNGITLPNGDNDHVLTSYGSTLNIGKYAKQSDLSSQLSSKANMSDLAELEQKVTANTTALEHKQPKGDYVMYSSRDDYGYYFHEKFTSSESFVVDDSDGNDVEYGINGVVASKYQNCLATSDGAFKPISDFVLKTELPTKTSQLTNNSNFMEANAVSDTYFALEKELKIYSEAANKITTISHNGIELEADETTIRMNALGFFVDSSSDGTHLCSFTSSGIRFAGKSANKIPTANNSFIDISNYATVDFVTAGLSAKQNKIPVNTVDVTDIETADITKLRTIVNNLISALSSSGLINATSGVE